MARSVVALMSAKDTRSSTPPRGQRGGRRLQCARDIPTKPLCGGYGPGNSVATDCRRRAAGWPVTQILLQPDGDALRDTLNASLLDVAGGLDPGSIDTPAACCGLAQRDDHRPDLRIGTAVGAAGRCGDAPPRPDRRGQRKPLAVVLTLPGRTTCGTVAPARPARVPRTGCPAPGDWHVGASSCRTTSTCTAGARAVCRQRPHFCAVADGKIHLPVLLVNARYPDRRRQRVRNGTPKWSLSRLTPAISVAVCCCRGAASGLLPELTGACTLPPVALARLRARRPPPPVLASQLCAADDDHLFRAFSQVILSMVARRR